MYLHIMAAAAYKSFWTFGCLYALPALIPRYA
jgi:hypothetical protein